MVGKVLPLHREQLPDMNSDITRQMQILMEEILAVADLIVQEILSEFPRLLLMDKQRWDISSL
jgi:hypothetical protein